jgi:hypothetical protein
MPTRSDAYNTVREDVLDGIGNIFVPREDIDPAFSLLSLGGADFRMEDIAENAEVSAVAWQLHAIHQRPLVATNGFASNGESIAVLQSEPPDHLYNLPHATGIAESQRPVTIYGVTLMITREGQEPMLMRFVDWADVYSQLGLAFSPRVPEVPKSRDHGRQRINDEAPGPVS